MNRRVVIARRVQVACLCLLLWLAAYFVLINIFSTSSEWHEIDHIYTSIFISVLTIGAVINEYFRRKYLSSGVYERWIWAAIGVMVGCTLFLDILFGRLIDFVLPGYYFISYYSWRDLVKFSGSFIALATMVAISIEYFQSLQERKRIAVLEKEKVTAEFKALANQVNPHFLFNCLTVIYSLSLKDSKETSAAVIKLSDILRYVIYRSSEPTVSVASEAAILRDYIDLQRYRVHPTTKIELIVEIDEDALIAPMLFLPLLENAFKHGVHNETENALVAMSLRVERGVVSFMISNNKSKSDNTGGIGLKNLQERLSLIYHDRHTFVVSDSKDMFMVNMQVSL